MTVLVDLNMTISPEGICDLPEDDGVLAVGGVATLQGVVRRFVLTPGDLWEDLGAGADLGSYQGAGVTSGQVDALQSRLQSEALEEDGAVDCNVSAVLDAARQILSVRGELVTDDGAFPFDVPLTADTAAAITARE